ncbi:hypothetical protein N9L68_02310 [bacterium]|nr:hypothetical protein [bacterium]
MIRRMGSTGTTAQRVRNAFGKRGEESALPIGETCVRITNVFNDTQQQLAFKVVVADAAGSRASTWEMTRLQRTPMRARLANCRYINGVPTWGESMDAELGRERACFITLQSVPTRHSTHSKQATHEGTHIRRATK